jgi:hypothetical protein
MRLPALLAACGGFLLAVLWFDLMFDVQVLGHAAAPAPLPEQTLASIAHYYARVTRGAQPMHLLVALVMAIAVLGSLSRAWRTPHEPGAWLGLLLAVIPIGLAGWRVFPNAVRLGTRTGTLAEQSTLARGILADHVFCWLAIAAFTVLQIASVSRTASRERRAPPAAAPR